MSSRISSLTSKSTFFWLILITALTLIAYSQTLSHGFVWDDASYIIDWSAVNFDPSNFLTGAQPGFHSGVYRPIRNLIYPLASTYCGLDPTCYHLQALVFHSFTAFLVFLITRHLTSSSPLAGLTSLLFALHPIHVESVAWVTASFDLIGIIFALTSFYLFLISPPHRSSSTSRLPPILHPLNRYLPKLSYTFALLAFLSNEITLVLPLIMISFRLLFPPSPSHGYIPHTIRTRPPLATLFHHLYSLRWYCLLALTYLPLRLIFMGNTWRRLTLDFDLIHRILLPIHVYFEYLINLIYPFTQSINHSLTPTTPSLYYLDQGLTPLSLSFNLHTLIIVSILFCLTASAIILRRRLPLYTFGVTWFFLALLPVSQIFPQAILFAERYAYFASIGFSISLTSLISVIIFSLATKSLHPGINHPGIVSLSKPIKTTVSKLSTTSISLTHFGVPPLLQPTPNLTSSLLTSVIIIVTSTVLCLQTQKHSRAWNNDCTLWAHTLHLHPHSPSALNGVGACHLSLGQPDLALPYFQQATHQNPHILTYHINYITTLEQVGDTASLIQALESLLHQNPRSPEALKRLVTIYTQLGDTDQAAFYRQQL